jgi:hypothetical protein
MRRVMTDLKFWMTAPNEPLWIAQARRRGEAFARGAEGRIPALAANA